jgi:hypothetical protein
LEWSGKFMNLRVFLKPWKEGPQYLWYL